MPFQEHEENVLRHLYMKSIILPRQARDKHRENSKKSNSDQQACRSMRLQKIDPLAAFNKQKRQPSPENSNGWSGETHRCVLRASCRHHHIRQRIARDHTLELGVLSLCLTKHGTCFECFPYVCPEPVLVKRSF
jgi:hypothetical protein